jgi:hypothetical protein
MCPKIFGEAAGLARRNTVNTVWNPKAKRVLTPFCKGLGLFCNEFWGRGALGPHEVDKESKEQTMVDPIIGLITPFKGEKTLKRLAIDITNMEIDTTSKKPRVSAQGKEVVEVDDDDD